MTNSLAHLAIHNEEVRGFWKSEIGNECVEWKIFWKKWLPWIAETSGESHCYHLLATDPSARKRWQDTVNCIPGCTKADQVTAEELNAAFPKQMSVKDVLTRMVQQQVGLTHKGTERAATRKKWEANFERVKTPIFSPQLLLAFSDVQSQTIALMYAIDAHITNLESACKLLLAASDTATEVSMNTATYTTPYKDCELDQMPKEQVGSLVQALYNLRTKLSQLQWPATPAKISHGLCSFTLLSLVQCLNSESQRRRRVISIVGPKLSGKTVLAMGMAGFLHKLRGEDCSTTTTVRSQPLILQLACCYSLDEAIHRLSATTCQAACIRDLKAPFRALLKLDRPIMVLDNADGLEGCHATDLVRLLLQSNPYIIIIITSRKQKIKDSKCCITVKAYPWLQFIQALSTAYMLSFTQCLALQQCITLAKLSRGVPGLINRLVNLTTSLGRQKRNIVLKLALAEKSSTTGRIKNPARHVRDVLYLLRDIISEVESSRLVQVVAAVGMLSQRLPSALCIAIANSISGCIAETKINQGSPAFPDVALVHPVGSHDSTQCSIPDACCQLQGSGVTTVLVHSLCSASASAHMPQISTGHNLVSKAIEIGLLEAHSEAGQVFITACGKLDGTDLPSRGTIERIVDKYMAALAWWGCSMYSSDPLTAVHSTAQFYQTLWNSLVKTKRSHIISCICGSMPLLEATFPPEMINQLLIRAAAASNSILHVKVLTCMARSLCTGTPRFGKSWKDLQKVVEQTCPWPSLHSLAFNISAPRGVCRYDGLETALKGRLKAAADGPGYEWLVSIACDWALSETWFWLSDKPANARAVQLLNDLLTLRKRFTSERNPAVWKHMMAVALVHHKSGELAKAVDLIEWCMIQQSVGTHSSQAECFCCLQYSGHLHWKLGSHQASHSAAQHGYKLLGELQKTDFCSRAVLGRNLLNSSKFDSAVACCLPVFQAYCLSDDHKQSEAAAIKTSLHVLIRALLEQQHLEECEAVILIILLKGLHDREFSNLCGHPEFAQLIPTAMIDFSSDCLCPWLLLAELYLKAGLLEEASAAARKHSTQKDNPFVREILVEALCCKGDTQGARYLLETNPKSADFRRKSCMLSAKIYWMQGKWRKVLKELEKIPLSETWQRDHADIYQLRSACLHMAGEQEAARECLFQCAMVLVYKLGVKGFFGDGSLEFASHLVSVSKQLVHEQKLKRASAMIQHALSIYDCGMYSKRAAGLGQATALSVLAHVASLNMQLDASCQASSRAILICKNLLWPHTAGDVVPYHLYHLWTPQRLAATHTPSQLCTQIHSTILCDNRKVEAYSARRIAAVASEAFIMHSQAVMASDLHSAMMSAANAVLCCHFASHGQGLLAAQAWCQVCTCAVVRLLQYRGKRWQLLCPWDLQTDLTHHTVLQVATHLAINVPGFQVLVTKSLYSEASRDTALPHNDSEAVFAELLLLAPYKGVESLSPPSLRHLCKRCSRNLQRFGPAMAHLGLQMKLTNAYLAFAEAAFEDCSNFLSGPEVLNEDTKTPQRAALKVEALCLLGRSRMAQGLFDQAEAAFCLAVKDCTRSTVASAELDMLKKKWHCVLLFQLACLYEVHLEQLEQAETCFRQCTVVVYSLQENNECADLVSNIASLVWKRFSTCHTQMEVFENSLTQQRRRSVIPTSVAIGDTVDEEALREAALGGKDTFDTLFNTMSSLLWRSLSLLQKSDTPDWRLCVALIMLSAFYHNAYINPTWKHADQAVCIFKAVDCSSQAIRIMGLQQHFESEVVVADMSTRSELERVVLQALLMQHYAIVSHVRERLAGNQVHGVSLDKQQMEKLNCICSQQTLQRTACLSCVCASLCETPAEMKLALLLKLAQVVDDDPEGCKASTLQYLDHEANKWLKQNRTTSYSAAASLENIMSRLNLNTRFKDSTSSITV